jgi:hypothetical protein
LVSDGLIPGDEIRIYIASQKGALGLVGYPLLSINVRFR